MAEVIMSESDIVNKIASLRRKCDLHASVGDGDTVNKVRDEIGSLYRILMNKTTTKEGTGHEQ